FDYIEGGIEDERGLETNASAFHKHRLLPRYLVDVSTRDQSKTIFGQKFSSPFGISPTGGTSLFRNHADLMLAEAARDANIPYIMSGGSSETIEAAAKIAPKNHWYQLYAARDPKINADMIRRSADVGLGALVLTVDTPVGGKRERNIRNGFANVRGGFLQALSLKPSILLEAMTHPGWIVEYVKRGGGRRPADAVARQRGAARRRYLDRAVPRRRFLLFRAADLVWRRGWRAARGQEGGRHFRQRDRPSHGADRLPELGPARPRFPVD